MSLKLTDTEKRMLDGLEGRLKQKAMEVIVRYANVLGAEALCEVTKAHLHCGAHHYLKAVQSEEIDRVISEIYFCSSETVPLDKVGCDCVSDVGAMCPDKWALMGVERKEFEKEQEYLQRYLSAGVKLYSTCVPYLLGFIPLMGEHFVTSESHVVLVANSLWGACGNSDGLEAGFCAAVCGRTPLWGNHIMSNRKGTHLIHIDGKCATGPVSDWDLLGYTIGRKLPPHSIPILAGKFSRPDIDKLKAFFASMATTGGPEMCHIIGITPEAVTLEQALGGKNPVDEVVITTGDVAASRDFFDADGRVDYISLGCPHYSLEEIRQVAACLEGKRISPNVHLHLWTAYAFKAVADRCGYAKTIERAGGEIMTSACPSGHETLPSGVQSIACDSTKMAHDFKSRRIGQVFHGSMLDCLNAALSGKWEGR